MMRRSRLAHTRNAIAAGRHNWSLCPVCGWYHAVPGSCHPRAARAIDAAHAGAELEPGLDREHGGRSSAQRLNEGLELLEMEDGDDFGDEDEE